jgi:aconitate hydratase
MPGDDAAKLGVTGAETFDVTGLAHIRPQQEVTLVMHRKDGTTREVKLLCRIDTAIEVDYYQHGGILPFVLRELVGQAA